MGVSTRSVPGRRLLALPGTDGKPYVYRVHAPGDALPGDLFRSAFPCHDDSRHPRLRPVRRGAHPAARSAPHRRPGVSRE